MKKFVFSAALLWIASGCSLQEQSSARAIPGAQVRSASVTSLASVPTSPYQIGVYYFGGWTQDPQIPFSTTDQFWTPIENFPERQPLLGFYNETTQSVMDQQLLWMADYGISYIAFDWYWNRTNPEAPKDELALNSYFVRPISPK